MQQVFMKGGKATGRHRGPLQTRRPERKGDRDREGCLCKQCLECRHGMWQPCAWGCSQFMTLPIAPPAGHVADACCTPPRALGGTARRAGAAAE